MRDNIKKDINFDELFEKYYPGLLFYAAQFLDEAEAKDVVQDVFFELWKRKDSVEMGDKIQSYLYRLVHNRSVNVLNHQKVKSKYSDAVVEMYNHKLRFYESPENNEIIQKLESQELSREISEAVGRLPGKCREVFKLSYLHGMKNKEIAEALDISIRTVEAHMYKALKLLRSSLKHLSSLLMVIFAFFLK